MAANSSSPTPEESSYLQPEKEPTIPINKAADVEYILRKNVRAVSTPDRPDPNFQGGHQPDPLFVIGVIVIDIVLVQSVRDTMAPLYALQLIVVSNTDLQPGIPGLH